MGYVIKQNSNISRLPFSRLGKFFGTLALNSELSDTDSKEGSQITLYGLGGNTGIIITIDCYNNLLRIHYQNEKGTVVYTFNNDGIYLNSKKITN